MTAIPLAELHLHLEGAAPPEFIRRLAEARSQDLSRIFDHNGDYTYEGFAGFLRAYEAAAAVLRGPDDYARLTREVLARSADQGVVYTEIFVSPDFCGQGDLDAWRDHLAAIREAALAAERDAGIVMRVVVTSIRHLGPDRARRAAGCAAETAGDFVTGFGVGGDEKAGRLADFAWSFDMAREAGLGLTAHAGEWTGPASVREALDALRVTRIGHGVRAIEDPALVERLARDGVTLEICPGSNLALGLYPRLRDHPVERLRSAGVPVTISTDDPPFFRTGMRREYERLAETFGWDGDRVRETALVAARAAFCDEKTRARLIERITA